MATLSLTEIKELVNKPKNRKVLERARQITQSHRLHVNGVGVGEFLGQINTYENDDQYKVRKKNGRPATVPIFGKETQPFDKVFSAQGEAKHYRFAVEGLSADFVAYLNNNIGEGRNMRQWMRYIWGEKVKTEPMGLMLVELPSTPSPTIPEPYVTFRSVDEIHDIDFNGSTIEYVILKYKKTIVVEGGEEKTLTEYRIIDDENDYIAHMEDSVVKVVEEDTIPNVWGYVPATFISQQEDHCSRAKTSYIWRAIGIADEYINDASIHQTSKWLHGFPQKWEYQRDCITCEGKGEIPNSEHEMVKCHECRGTGIRLKADASQVILLPQPEGDDPIIGEPAGYITTDVSILKEQREELSEMRQLIRLAIWSEPDRATFNEKTEGTATGRMLDASDVHDKLDMISENAEAVEKFLTDAIGQARYSFMYKGSIVHYGRRYLLKSANQIEREYIEAKKGGLPTSVLNAMREELIHVKYKNDPDALDRQKKLMQLEPFPDYTISEVTKLEIPKEDKLMKLYFNDYVEQFEMEKGSVNLYDISTIKTTIETYNKKKLTLQPEPKNQIEDE